jgi:hypothetical protein
MKTCPYCAGRVADSTVSCPHCERDLTVEGMRRYFFLVKGESKGPFTLSEVRQYASSDSMVSHGEDWLPAREHPDLRGLRWDDEPSLPGELERVPYLGRVLAVVIAGVVIGLVMVAWSLISLHGGFDGEEQPPEATPLPRQEDPELARAVAAHLQAEYGLAGYAASWYGNVREVHVFANEVEVVTDLLHPGNAARNVCGAVATYLDRGEPAAEGLHRVTVRNLAGTVLAGRGDAGEECR